jgi:hypothetical protein
MARCEQGYLCDVCGQEVQGLAESALYLRYVLGDTPPEQLLGSRERHLRCEPSLAQFIVDPLFPAVACAGPFAKNQLDPGFVREEEARVTRGWRRLQEAATQGLAVPEYPLEEVRARWAGGDDKARLAAPRE